MTNDKRTDVGDVAAVTISHEWRSCPRLEGERVPANTRDESERKTRKTKRKMKRNGENEYRTVVSTPTTARQDVDTPILIQRDIRSNDFGPTDVSRCSQFHELEETRP